MSANWLYQAESSDELLQEVLSIEKAIVLFTASVNPYSKQDFKSISNRLNRTKPMEAVKVNWISRYSGWAAAIILGGILAWTMQDQSKMEAQLAQEKQILTDQMELVNANLQDAQKLVSIFRNQELIAVPLAGQEAFSEAYANVYWDKKESHIYVDTKGLPAPPAGKVYQVWSLKLNPLRPTSLGLIDDSSAESNDVFALENVETSEAFGITLEPAGGSKTPTMEQLYTLGVVSES